MAGGTSKKNPTPNKENEHSRLAKKTYEEFRERENKKLKRRQLQLERITRFNNKRSTILGAPQPKSSNINEIHKAESKMYSMPGEDSDYRRDIFIRSKKSNQDFYDMMRGCVGTKNRNLSHNLEKYGNGKHHRPQRNHYSGKGGGKADGYKHKGPVKDRKHKNLLKMNRQNRESKQKAKKEKKRNKKHR